MEKKDKLTTNQASDDEDSQLEEKNRLRKEALAYRQSLERRGVVYISRVPPFMKPNKIRTLLEPYGEITRLFLAEEDAESRKKRKEHGGNGSRQFKEGWVEFSDKKVAKQVAESLNNTQIGNRKGDYYHDDIWNLKYLKNFKWEYLTEKQSYEKRIREQKMKANLIQSKKRNAEIQELMEQTKVQEKIQAKRKLSNKYVDSTDSSNIGQQSKRVRLVPQKTAPVRGYEDERFKMPLDVLEKLFAKKKTDRDNDDS